MRSWASICTFDAVTHPLSGWKGESLVGLKNVTCWEGQIRAAKWKELVGMVEVHDLNTAGN